MALDIVGAGFGRTGTLALKSGLERLGFRRCYHMLEVSGNPGHVDQWQAAALGETIDWDALFAGYRAALDWPACRFWRELAAHYPGAKVVLTVRDPEAWYDSVAKTIYTALTSVEDDPERRARREMARRVILEQTFDGRFEDRAHALEVFRSHRDAVVAALPPERLLVYQVDEGWDPLCRFLGCEVPPEAFPHLNTTTEFRERLGLPVH